jgi:hypothetical protein
MAVTYAAFRGLRANIVGSAGAAVKALYDTAAGNVPTNGKRIADFIKASGMDPKKVHCIGHSLGMYHCCFMT